MLVNKGYIYLDTQGIQIQQFTSVPLFFDVTSSDYFLLEFFDKESIEKFGREVLDQSTLQQIKEGTVSLLLYNRLEGFLSYIDTIYKLFVVEYGIPEEKIVLLSNNNRVLSVTKDVANKYKKQEIVCVWVRHFEMITQRHIMRVNSSSRTYQSSYSKKFLCLNRRWRLHRPTLVSLLKIRGLLELGHVSLAECEGYNWGTTFDSMLEANKDTEIYNSLVNHRALLTEIPDMYLDTTTQEFNLPLLDKKQLVYYNETYFSVIPETLFYKNDEGVFFTEKVFKSIIVEHPFIIVSRPKFLSSMKELGYKTFSAFINENYDDEYDDGKRMMMVVDEIERLCKLSGSELQDFIEGCREICAFNKTHFYSPPYRKRFFTRLN